MKKFIKPVLHGRVKEAKDKKIIYEPESDDFIVAPYDGIIDEIQEGLRENRNGFIRIKHSVDGETYYSEISGLKDITTQRGVDVRQKDKLSRTGNYDVEYEIKNKSIISNAGGFSPRFTLYLVCVSLSGLFFHSHFVLWIGVVNFVLLESILPSF